MVWSDNVNFLWNSGVHGTRGTTPLFEGGRNLPDISQILLEQRYGRAVDWWAFGVLTYEMLLGQSPFRGEDEDEIFDAILEDEPLYPITMPRDAVSILQKVGNVRFLTGLDMNLMYPSSFYSVTLIDASVLGRRMPRKLNGNLSLRMLALTMYFTNGYHLRISPKSWVVSYALFEQPLTATIEWFG